MNKAHWNVNPHIQYKTIKTALDPNRNPTLLFLIINFIPKSNSINHNPNAIQPGRQKFID